ncbi:DUF5336 domain-containing protein [Actinokineospora pegani]|uniref:DUF5336 domain-containing protein n=1 Tax=Actinokineospora pegani TaxID=2654637 RepID=UPI0012EA664C|nr:DUF5336 domain-containing protein [Actinokineospora pegani]
MTYPGGGAPGGYPGPGQQQQPAFAPAQPTGPGVKLSLAQILALVGAGLGLLNLFLGFAPVGSGGSGFYGNVVGWIPALLFIGGALNLAAILPGDKKLGLAPSVVTAGGALSFLFTVFAIDGSLGTGSVLILIFGLIQLVVVVGAYLFELGVIKPPAPKPQVPQYPQSNPFPPQPGQPGGFNPPSGQFQSPYGQPPPGQQTTFAPQQGQFGTPPGTPPGGYPQQPQQ